MKCALIAAPIAIELQEFLKSKDYVLVSSSDAVDWSILEGIVTSNKLRLDSELLSKCHKLRWIARMGSGMEIVDTDYCKLHNIRYFSSPKGIANSVGEHALGMLLNLTKNIGSSFDEIKEGKWIREPNRGDEIENWKVGLIGYGHTAQAFAKKLAAFTPHVFAYDKYKRGFSSDIVKEVSLEYVLKEAYVVSFHVPLNGETQHYYNDEFMSKMENKHLLINTSRGAVCSTDTILKGLRSEKLIGACLDVLEEEADIYNEVRAKEGNIKELLKHKVIITPHIAGYSHGAVTKMSIELKLQLESVIGESQ